MCALSAINWNQGWPIIDSTRLPPMWPGFDPRTRRCMWVEFVVVCCFERFFFVYSGFPPLLKNQHFQIQIRYGILGPRNCQSQQTVKVSRALNRRQRSRYAFGINFGSFTIQCLLFYSNLVLAGLYFTF